MLESTIDINFYKRVLLEELIEEVKGIVPIGGMTTWSEFCMYNKIIKMLEDRLENFKEDTDE